MPRHAIARVTLVVRDYDEAVRFFLDALDFVLLEDRPDGDKRWVVVAPRSGGTSVVLGRSSNPGQAARVGDQTGGRVAFFLATDDCRRDFERMRAAGVRFVREPTAADFGVAAVFEDLYGNKWDLVESRRRAVGDVLTFPGAALRDPAVERWFQGGELKVLARRWFDEMKACGDVRELLHDGAPTACVDDAGFAYVDAFQSHVNVGFFQGASLPDPVGLLRGTGKRMRHVRLGPGIPSDEGALRALIRAAYDDLRGRLA
jgi:predicted enzyme related to lactoylglutathione lyase